jgi:hypothetical protein
METDTAAVTDSTACHQYCTDRHKSALLVTRTDNDNNRSIEILFCLRSMLVGLLALHCHNSTPMK